MRNVTGLLALILLVACGGEENGVGALCRKGSINIPENVVTCAPGLTCCGGGPDTAGYCQSLAVGTSCPARAGTR
jgi:hypothetical protein